MAFTFNCYIYIALFFLFFFKTPPTFSKNIDYSVRFRSISTKDGLSENHINCIIQDRSGYMWIGTDGGLNRYDGYEFKKYVFDPLQDTILRSNIIQCMDEDNNGNIWIGTPDRGYYKFCVETETFESFRNRPSDSKHFLNNDANNVAITNDGSIWFSGLHGIDVLVPDTTNETGYKNYKYHFKIEYPNNNTIRNLRAIKTDCKGRIWIGTHNGLFRAVKISGADKPYELLPIPEFKGKVIHNLERYNSYMYLSMNDGVYRVKILENYRFEIKKITSSFVRKFSIDVDGNLIGGFNNGLHICNYDAASDSYKSPEIYNASQNTINNISENNITTTFIDRTGLLWIGTNVMGLNIFDPGRKKIKLHYDIGQARGTSSKAVRSIYQDRYKNIWVGTVGEGLYFKENGVKNMPFRNITIPKGDQSGYNTIFCFTECKMKGESYLLIGMGYPMKYAYIKSREYKQGKFTIYPIDDFPSSVMHQITDRDGTVWAGTYGNGLYRLYPETKGLNYWENINTKTSKLSSPIVRSVAEDALGNIWVGTANGLNLIPNSERKKKSPNIVVFDKISTNGSGLSHNYILPLLVASDGRLWVGTMGGGVTILTRKEQGQFHFDYLTSRNGLPDNTIKGILEDEKGNMWISTNKGISRYDIKSKKVNNYFLSDGLQDNEFLDLSCYKTEDGEQYFGGVKGLNSFYPNQLKNNLVEADPIITGLQVNNKEVQVNDESSILHRIISSTDTIELDYKQNNINLTFSAIHFASPEKNMFKYRLCGFNNDWVTTNATNRIAKYTNLYPGKYVFELMVSNNDDVWNDKPAQLTILIKAPFYLSTFAKVLYFVLFILLLVVVNRYSLISRTIKSKLLVERLQKEKQEEINQLKLKLFTDISHEFRTPLTMIKGPISQLIDNDVDLNKEQRLKLYNTVLNSSDQILHLVDQLMNFRKTETGKMPLKVSKHNLGLFLYDYISRFNPWAVQKNIDLISNVSETHNLVWCDLDILQKIMNNLLSNAMKFTQAGGEVEVGLSFDNKNDIACIYVKDNGNGIPEDVLPNIFDRFYKTDRANEIGIGIGLSFVRSLVKLHHGTINCKSTINVGTTFSFHFPMNNSAYKSNEIVQNKHQSAIKRDQVYIPLPTKGATVRKLKRIERKVLIVDDNASIRRFITENLSSQFQVLTASNGLEAVSLTLQEHPDVIVSDFMMPIKDGFTLLQELREMPETSHIPVILLSARTSDESKQIGYNAGADGFIEKPFNIKVLISKLNSIYTNRRIVQEKFRTQIKVEPKEITHSNRDAELVEKLITFVEDRIGDTHLKIEELSKHACISNTNLNNKLKAITGLTTGAFIRTIRIKRAAQLLAYSDLTVAEITFKVGFNDLKYFRSCFKRELSLTPIQYRNREQNKSMSPL